MSTSGSPTFSLIVTGDVVIDHHLYEGKRDTPTTNEISGLRDLREDGGAAILAKLIEEVFAAKNPEWCVHRGVAVDEKSGSHHAYAVWSPHLKSKDEKEKKEKDQTKVWRVRLPMGYGGPAERIASNVDPKPVWYSLSPNPPRPKILVMDDAGLGFRHQVNRPSWLLPAKDPAPDWIVLKMSQPVVQGDLWHELVSRFPDRLVCIVSADELRLESVKISRGLSWERAAEEVRDALLTDPVLAEMTKCRHLIVRFAADGALWLDRTDAGPKARLVFDADGAEGDWEEKRDGTVFGSSATLTAAIAYELAQSAAERERNPKAKEPDLVLAIKAGLAAVGDLVEYGHGLDGKEPPDGFPAARLAAVLTSAKTEFAVADVPWPKPGETLPETGYPWMIVDFSQRPAGQSTTHPTMVVLARQVVLRGDTALAQYPHVRVGNLVTVDRLEVELLRALRRLMTVYQKKAKPKRPLSIGVFGPPGAGKSFAVKEIANEIFGKEAWIEFNLSQFNGPTDLVGAFHQVRDIVLSGVTPVVFWDEFDSDEYAWLKYLLAPMQDGRFQDDQLNHAIGKCVFVFAGGTSWTFDEFGTAPKASTELWRNFKLKKGPDFHSRLDGYYDVVGPNQRALSSTEEPVVVTPSSSAGGQPKPKKAEPKLDPTDVCFPVRRALLMRSMMGCKRDERLDFDPYLLDALLLVHFKHGARSLEKMVSELRPKGGSLVRRSDLPPPALLAMHVCSKVFDGFLKRNAQFLMMSQEFENLAAAITRVLAQIIQGPWLGDEATSRSGLRQAGADRPGRQSCRGTPNSGIAVLGGAWACQRRRQLAIRPGIGRIPRKLPVVLYRTARRGRA